MRPVSLILQGTYRAEGYIRHLVNIDGPIFAYRVVTPENEDLTVMACITNCGWEHVVVRRDNTDQLPTWDHMAAVKDLLFYPYECVVQFHPPADEYVNIDPRTLHLWRHQSKPFPLPAKELV